MEGKELYNEEENKPGSGDFSDSDDFGLPSAGKSADESKSKEPAPAPVTGGYTATRKKAPEPPKRSGGWIIFMVIVIVLAGVFAVYWFFLRKPKVKEVVKPVVDTTTVVPEPVDTLPEVVPEEPMPTELVEGAIQTITEKTGRYYVIISSSVDGDLANDYAKKLSDGGVSCMILGPPDGKGFYRLALADYGTFSEANTRAIELKGTYGEEVWVFKF
jgi:hypothetical protein